MTSADAVSFDDRRRVSEAVATRGSTDGGRGERRASRK
jgi:hypothetical protein